MAARRIDLPPNLALIRERFLRADANLGSATLPSYVSAIAN
jgi:hypothetical protein